ncbi:MAG: DUF2238 domain-containing protein [Myxococcota bacterium]
MDSSAPQRVSRPFAGNRPLQAMVVVYGLAWIAGAVAPVDRETWLLENLLVFAAVAVLAATHGRWAFSNLSYALLGVFLLLHVVGSHYTYSAVPPGDWVRDTLGLTRNHYDRFVHGCFGLLCAYPLREITLRRVHAHRSWSYLIPVFMVVAVSASYEVIEWAAARTVDPEVGVAYVGAQGDVWDGQKDMFLALLGASLAMALTGLYRLATGREPYRGPFSVGPSGAGRRA